MISANGRSSVRGRIEIFLVGDPFATGIAGLMHPRQGENYSKYLMDEPMREELIRVTAMGV